MTQTKQSVFLSATFAYSIYYVCRLSLSVVKGSLVDGGVLTPTQLGWIGSALFYSYGVGKLVNGFLADRTDLRKFATFGLLGTALVNLTLGFTTGFWLFFGLWLVNGWCQSMGAPSFVVGLTRWFTTKERGTYYGVWSGSHNLGEALTFVLTTVVVVHFGWRGGFIGSALLGLVGAGILWCFFGDRTERVSLEKTSVAASASAWAEQRAMLRTPAVWEIALASSFMYVVRYAINSWGLFFLQKAKGYAPVEASFIISVSSIAGIAGTVLSGWISDRWFGGDRFKPAILMGMLNTLSLLAFALVPPSWRWLDIAAMAAFGISIGALLCYLGGLMAVDLVSPKAAGAALGVVGIASYIGAGTQDVVSGYLIDAFKTNTGSTGGYNFTPMLVFWLIASFLSVLMTIVSWRTSLHRRRASLTSTISANLR